MTHPTQPQPIKREPLKWLFIAHFKDGGEYHQTLEDKCLTRTDGTGSAFTDVLARESELMAFSLSRVDSDDIVAVDLTTGAFIVNGVPMVIHEQLFEPLLYELRLIYFRETRAQQTQNAKGEVLGERHFVSRYFIGWQTTVAGKNKQVTLAVG